MCNQREESTLKEKPRYNDKQGGGMTDRKKDQRKREKETERL